jgi:hypothetical protein
MTESPTTTAAELIDTHLRAYCEPDVDRRRELLVAAWSPEGQLIDPPFDGTGVDGISAMVDTLLEHYPSHRFERRTDVDSHHSFARYGWSLVAPDGTSAVTGTDVVELGPDGRIVRIVGFFGDQVTTGG